VFPAEAKIPETWAKIAYMMNRLTNVPVNNPENTQQRKNTMLEDWIIFSTVADR
jgi:hypothetical protein